MSKLYDTTTQQWLEVVEIDYHHKRVLFKDGESHTSVHFSQVFVKGVGHE